MISDILQPTHLLFVLVVALLVLGPKRLPEAGRALGKGIRDFRSAIGGEDDRHDAIPPTATPVAAQPMPAPAAAAAPTHEAFSAQSEAFSAQNEAFSAQTTAPATTPDTFSVPPVASAPTPPGAQTEDAEQQTAHTVS